MTTRLENDQTLTPAEFFRLALLFEGGLLVVAIVLAAFMDPPPWLRLDLGFTSVLFGLVSSLPMLVALWLLRNVRSGAVGRLNHVVDEWLVPLVRGAPLWQYAVIAALAGMGEELLFRGVFQQWLTPPLGPWLAITATSIVFGLAHLITPLYGLLAALVSVYLGWLYHSFDSLTIPIVAHAFYDFIALSFLVRTAPASIPSADSPNSKN
jgi:membrane protease YdiL (CAAX protease family)